MAATDVGTGTSITFQSGFFAEIADIQISGSEMQVIDAPHMAGAGLHKVLFGRLQRPPQLVVEVNLNTDKDWKAILAANPETVTITFPTPSGGTSGATWVGTAKAVAFEAGIPVDDKMSGTITLQYSSLLTFTAST